MAIRIKLVFTRDELRQEILRGNRTVYFAFYRMTEHGVNIISRYELALLGGKVD